jgi:Tol biopolymer transport system component
MLRVASTFGLACWLLLVFGVVPVAGAEALSLFRLTRDPALDAMPSWAPDGRWLVFHSRRRPKEQRMLPTRKIWRIATDGTGETQLSDGPADEYHASFSPDGRKILFVSEAAGSRDIWVMGADGSNPVPLTDDPGMEEHPAWSPDGRRIVYAGLPKEGGNFDLWIMNDDGSARRKITFTAANEIFPAWHPDGKTIAFSTDVNGNFDLYAIRLDDEKVFPLVTGPDHETRPAWSPDGQRLAFARWPVSATTDEARIWVANADGSGAVPLDVPLGSTHPAWSPDGRRLAFQHRADGNWDLWIVTIPQEVLATGPLRLARRGGSASEDVVELRGGERLAGTILTDPLRLRSPYGAIPIPARELASVEFAGLETGIAKAVAANGDTFSGFLENPEIEIRTGHGVESVRRERIAALGFRAAAASVPGPGPWLRVAMKNGDLFSARLRTSALRLRLGERTVELPTRTIARIDFGEPGEKTRVVTRDGESLAATLENSLLELELAIGPLLALYPPAIRSLAAPGEAP